MKALKDFVSSMGAHLKSVATLFKAPFDLLMSTTTREITDVETMLGTGFLAIQQRFYNGQIFYAIKTKGGNSYIWVTFTQEQFEELGRRITRFAESGRQSAHYP